MKWSTPCMSRIWFHFTVSLAHVYCSDLSSVMIQTPTSTPFTNRGWTGWASCWHWPQCYHSWLGLRSFLPAVFSAPGYDRGEDWFHYCGWESSVKHIHKHAYKCFILYAWHPRFAYSSEHVHTETRKYVRIQWLRVFHTFSVFKCLPPFEKDLMTWRAELLPYLKPTKVGLNVHYSSSPQILWIPNRHRPNNPTIIRGN